MAWLVLTVAAPASASTVRDQEWWLRALHVTQAWHSTRAKGVTVAVLDTGVDSSQADLTGSVVTGPDYTNSGRRAGGPFWGVHGTAMASLIAGHGHGRGRSEGILGTAPAATILSVRVTLESDDPMLADPSVAARLPDAIARGIRYAVGHGASVIDLPLDPVTARGAAGAGGSTAERRAVAYALAHRVVLVAPAGDNSGGIDPVNYPAAYPGVVSVGAFNSAFVKAPFSSRRPYVTLTAAGDGVIAAAGTTGYAPISSTSAASAVVAGIVALIRAQFPGLDPAQVTKALTESTRFGRPGGQRDGSGAGTVDAAAALMAAARMANTVPTAGSASAQPPSSSGAQAAGSMRRTLFIDAGIALAAFLLVSVSILGYGRLRRRRARAARLAEVRAAAQPAPRRPRREAPVPAATAPESYLPAPVGPEVSATVPAAPGVRTAARAPWDDEGLAPGGGFTGGPPTGSPPTGSPLAGGPPTGGPFTGSAAPGIPAPGSAPPGTGFSGGSFTDRVAPGGTFPGSAFPRAGYRGAPGGRAESAGTAGPPRLSGPGGPPLPAGLPTAGRGGASWPDVPGLPGPAGREPVPRTPAQDAPARPGPAGPDRGVGGGIPARGPVARGPVGRRPMDAGAVGRSGADSGAVGGGAPGEGTGSSQAAADGTERLIGSHRPGMARPRTISGRPPWDPAPPPPGEAPWSQPPVQPASGAGTFLPSPPPAPAGRAPAPPPEPPPSLWDAIAEEAWPGGPATSRPLNPPPPQPASGREYEPGSGSGPHSGEPATGARPIYVWNPAASTENLPVVPPGENHQR